MECITTVVCQCNKDLRGGREGGTPVPMKDALSLGMESLSAGQLPSLWGTLVVAISRSSSSISSVERLVNTYHTPASAVRQSSIDS
jgi:hypothetical protein